ncbi:MAG: glycosyltransferase family 4 protein [Anaerolineae bacterium]|nr:glycosyltransferase family 4 protein [Anaerolineae bacterium]
MHILIINSEYPPIGGGASNASAHLARTLVELGHQVTVLTSRFAALPHDEVQQGVRIVRIPAIRRRQDRSGPLEQLSFMLLACLSAVNQVRRSRPTVVLAFFGVPSGAVALWLRILCGLPYIVSLRGGDVPGFRPYDFALYHRLIAPLLHIVWRRAAAVVANSAGLRDLALAFDRNVPIQVIPNGVDVAPFSTTPRRWQPPRMLIVGRVVYQKGIDLLLHALAGLKDLSWQLSIAGDGPLRFQLAELASRLDLADRVKFLGWQEKSALVQHFDQANLFVYPSRHEGMPNALLEAMAAGLPAIASQIAGSEELVLPDQTGLLVPTEDSQALRVALRQLLPDAARREHMGAAARQRVEQYYSWHNVAQQYLALFQTAVEVD